MHQRYYLPKEILPRNQQMLLSMLRTNILQQAAVLMALSIVQVDHSLCKNAEKLVAALQDIVITTAGNLKATLLKSAHLESLKLASARKIKSIAFPALSTGVYGYPTHDAAQIALKTTIDYLKEHRDIERVHFVLFDRTTYDIFTEELKKLI
jgi:hypothetical protein